ncbi:MAG TPA: TldD/PmbA family protein [Thermoleophilia bacterium]|nr:TldD/PmbA family protein [Thermoleophilia bacterium]
MSGQSPGLTPALADVVLARVLRHGGDYAEIFAEDRSSLSVRLDDRRLEEVSSGVDRGASIRLVKGPTTSCGYVDALDEGSLIGLADRLSAGVSGGPLLPVSLNALQPLPRRQAGGDPAAMPAPVKADMLRAVDAAARGRSAEVRQVAAGYSESRQRIWVAGSRGVFAHDDRTRMVLSVNVVAQRGDVIQTGRETLSGTTGFGLFEDGSPVLAALEATEKALVMLESRPAPSGRMPVVLANGFGGVLFHEACGHGLEADYIVKKTSIWEGKRGTRVAEPFVTALDDGVTPGLWGSNSIDDEGTNTEATVVIEEGVLTGYLTDLLRGERLGMASTGNGRRQGFRHLPYPRMTNAYFAAGAVTVADLIADTPRAFYAKSLSGGQVDPATGDFVFGVSEGYLIEGGRVGPAVRGATLIGNGAEVLRSIDAIADDLVVKAGMCGKEGQAVPVGTGQPTLRIRELTVGGTAV